MEPYIWEIQPLFVLAHYSSFIYKNQSQQSLLFHYEKGYLLALNHDEEFDFLIVFRMLNEVEQIFLEPLLMIIFF
jgi:hypothetical protein